MVNGLHHDSISLVSIPMPNKKAAVVYLVFLIEPITFHLKQNTMHLLLDSMHVINLFIKLSLMGNIMKESIYQIALDPILYSSDAPQHTLDSLNTTSEV